MFSDQLIDQLSQFIIRPHREIYGLDKLGPRKIILKSVSLGCYIQAYRQQSTIPSQGKKIQLSIFQPHLKNGSCSPTSSPLEESQNLSKSWKTNVQQSSNEIFSEVTIFLHTNSGSRLEGLQYSKFLLAHGHPVCLFDYSGSGVSEGQYVTMGLNEAKDLANVVRYLQDKFGVEKVNLWGRSMGAVTAVLYSARYPRNVKKIVLDSPFCSFRQLVKQIVNSRTGLPEFLFGAVLNRIEENLKKKLNLNMMDIDLKQQIIKPGMQKIPIFFLISKDDKLVLPSHVETLYELHKGQKKILYLQGSHNKPRPTDIREQCADFLCQKMINVSSQKSIESSKRQYLSIISRKYSEQIVQEKKQKSISSSMIIDASDLIKTNSMQFEKSNNSNVGPISPTLLKEPLFLNLNKKSKNQTIQNSAQSTPRDDHSTNKASGMKISLSQLKKSQTQMCIDQQLNRGSIPQLNASGYAYMNGPASLSNNTGYQSNQHGLIQPNQNGLIQNNQQGLVQNSQQGLVQTQCYSNNSNLQFGTIQNNINSMGGQKGQIYFKKHSRAMAIQYKNKIKQHISKT